MRTTLKIIAAVAGISCIAPATAGDDPLEDAIEARRGYMRVVEFNVGPLFGMAKGKMDYNAEAAATYAGNLQALAMMNNGALWPEGSDNEFYSGVTRAQPSIWKTYPKVAEVNQEWKDAVGELAKVAGEGLDALRSKLGAVGDACQSCHDDFRAEDF